MSTGTDKLGNATPPGPNTDPSATEIRAELDRILASHFFSGARRPSDFLRFVVENVLKGGGTRIKEYLIGVDVFGRSADYDPRLDPVVRIEAGRLRTKLGQYYAGTGKDDPIVIDLPKGSYVPEFRRQPRAPGLDAPARSMPTKNSSLSGKMPTPQYSSIGPSRSTPESPLERAAVQSA